jgi:hypothetical protein
MQGFVIISNLSGVAQSHCVAFCHSAIMQSRLIHLADLRFPLIRSSDPGEALFGATQPSEGAYPSWPIRGGRGGKSGARGEGRGDRGGRSGAQGRQIRAANPGPRAGLWRFSVETRGAKSLSSGTLVGHLPWFG